MKFDLKKCFSPTIRLVLFFVLGSWLIDLNDIKGLCPGIGVSYVNAETADEYVNLGKAYLESKDIVLAHNNFELALDLDQFHPEANFFYSLTRILTVPYQSELNDLLDGFGIDAEGRDIYHWTACFQQDIDGNILLPENSPASGEALSFLENNLIPQILGALDNLSNIDNTFETVLSAAMTDSDIDLEVDYGDIALYRSSLNFLKAFILILNSYDLDLDIDSLTAQINDGSLNIKTDIVEHYFNFLNLISADKLLNANQALADGIDNYIEASVFIREEADPQSNDLIALDPEDLEDEWQFRLGILQLKDALLGNSNQTFTVELSQFADLGELFENPFNLRDFMFGGGIQTFLKDHISPQLERALNNLSGLNNSFSQILVPESDPVSKIIEIDFGDIAMSRAALYSLQSAVKIFCAYDMDIDILDIINKIDDETLSYNNDLLGFYPDFLTLMTENRLTTAKADMNDAIAFYNLGSSFIRHEIDDQEDDLIVIDIEDLEDEFNFRLLLTDIQTALAGPAMIGQENPLLNEPLTIDLGIFFDDQIALRGYLPEFGDDNEIISNSFPDPGFNEILPYFTQAKWNELLDLSVVVSGNVSCAAYDEGFIYIAAYDGNDPFQSDLLGHTQISSQGSYAFDVSAGEEVWISAYWDKDENQISTPGDYCGYNLSNPVIVPGVGLSNINLNLSEQLVGISGNVSDGANPISNVIISLYFNKCWHDFAKTTSTDSNGNYSFLGLPEGNYFVNAFTWWYSSYSYEWLYSDEWFNNTSDCNQAIPVPVANNSNNIDFVLNRCEGDFDYDGDVDGKDLAEFAESGIGILLEKFAEHFGRTNCK